MKLNKNLIFNVLIYMFIIFIVLFFLFPILWIGFTSFKYAKDVNTLPPKIIFEPTMKNYFEVWQKQNFPNIYLNSIIVAFFSSLFVMLLAYPTAYAFARLKIWRKKDIAIWMLSCSMIPPIAVSIPIFLLFKTFGLYDSRIGLILIHTGINLPLAIWLLTGFIKEIPHEIEESAMVDGCNQIQTILKIVLPITFSGAISTAVLIFIFSWNEFLLALVLTGQKSRTLPVAIYSFINFREILWGPLTASAVLVSLPVLIFSFFIRKYLVRGLTFGAVKG